MKTSAPAFTFPVLDIPFGVNNKYFNQPAFFWRILPIGYLLWLQKKNGLASKAAGRRRERRMQN